LKLSSSSREMMRSQSAAIGMLLMLVISTSSAGCLGLVMQREIMEGIREEPEPIDKPEQYSWDYTFESDSFEAIQYHNETSIFIDETVKNLVITFVAQFPYSTLLEEVIGNETNEYRYVEVNVWEPGVKEAGGDPFWFVRATEEYPIERFEFNNVVEGNWLVEVDARGYGWDAPLDPADFHDHFVLTLTIIKPCIYFAEVHDEDECTWESEL